jgi:hypothetical protein
MNRSFLSLTPTGFIDLRGAKVSALNYGRANRDPGEKETADKHSAGTKKRNQVRGFNREDDPDALGCLEVDNCLNSTGGDLRVRAGQSEKLQETGLDPRSPPS